MRLSAAEVLDWLDKQHMANASERKRRAALQLVLDAAGEPHSADDLLGIAAYRPLGVSSTSSVAHARACTGKGKPLFQVRIEVQEATAAQLHQEGATLADGTVLRFACTSRKNKTCWLYMYFSSVEAAVQARDEAYFIIYGMCVPIKTCTFCFYPCADKANAPR